MPKINSIIFFLFLGLVITVAFVFLPKVYDPLIIKSLPIESIAEDQELVDYLISIQDQDNIIIGVHGYIHRSPSGETICEYYCSDEEISLETVQRKLNDGLNVFESAGLNAGWIAPPGESYDDRFLNLTKIMGYIEEDYELESPAGHKNPLQMIIKPKLLGKIENFKQEEGNIVFKEYTDTWGKDSVTFDDYNKTIAVLKKDMMTSVDGLLLHVHDYNDDTEKFVKKALNDYDEIGFLRVDDIASSYDLPRLKKLVNLADETGRMLFIAVIPAHKINIGSPEISNIIKTTWFVFIPFFLFPLAFMIPLHWHERKKFRKTKMKNYNPPKVSLILPAYNEEKIIGTSIEKALDQDYEGELEIIIIDDGSTDMTFEIARAYAIEFPEIIKVHKHQKNSGKPAGLNTGFHIATGEISVFSDSDSYLNKDLVSKMVPHFEDPRVGMVSGMIIIDNDNSLLTKLQQIEYLYNQEIIRFCQAVHKGVLICPGAATGVRTQIARDIPSTERTITEDADFTFQVAEAGWLVTQEPEAISWTEAPEKLAEFIDQRKRWLYGVIQTIWIHKWALFFKDSNVPNLWVWWAWVGYITCPITTLAVILMPLLYWLLGPGYLIFLAWYSLIFALVYGFATWYGLKQYVHEKKTKLMLLFPIYLIYQYLLNILLCYLVFAFILRKGVKVRYGGRKIHAI